MQAGMIRWVAPTVATALATRMLVLAAEAGPAAAAKTPSPCKLLKASEISKEFDGATVSRLATKRV